MGYLVHPQNSLPAVAPNLAMRSVRGLRQRGHLPSTIIGPPENLVGTPRAGKTAEENAGRFVQAETCTADRFPDDTYLRLGYRFGELNFQGTVGCGPDISGRLRAASGEGLSRPEPI